MRSRTVAHAPRALAAVLLAVMASGRACAQQAPLPASLIALDSDEGQRLLLEARARQDFFGLAGQFVSQQAQSYCGVASSTMVLNALQLPAPAVAAWAPYRSFTQDNLFTAAASQAVARATV